MNDDLSAVEKSEKLYGGETEVVDFGARLKRIADGTAPAEASTGLWMADGGGGGDETSVIEPPDAVTQVRGWSQDEVVDYPPTGAEPFADDAEGEEPRSGYSWQDVRGFAMVLLLIPVLLALVVGIVGALWTGGGGEPPTTAALPTRAIVVPPSTVTVIQPSTVTVAPPAPVVVPPTTTTAVPSGDQEYLRQLTDSAGIATVPMAPIIINPPEAILTGRWVCSELASGKTQIQVNEEMADGVVRRPAPLGFAWKPSPLSSGNTVAEWPEAEGIIYAAVEALCPQFKGR